MRRPHRGPKPVGRARFSEGLAEGQEDEIRSHFKGYFKKRKSFSPRFPKLDRIAEKMSFSTQMSWHVFVDIGSYTIFQRFLDN